VTKPFDPKELVARVGAMLRLRRAERDLRARNRALAALNAVADTIGRAIELPDVLNTALDQVLATLDMEAGTITLAHWDGSQFPPRGAGSARPVFRRGLQAGRPIRRAGAPELSVRGATCGGVRATAQSAIGLSARCSLAGKRTSIRPDWSCSARSAAVWRRDRARPPVRRRTAPQRRPGDPQ
jgi:hypothetical protein